MKKTKLFWYLLDTIFVIVFNLYFFLLTGKEHPVSVWVSYAAIHFAYFMLLATPYFVRKGSASADYKRPLFTVATSYFFLALVAGVVFIILAPESYKIALLVQATIAAVFVIILLGNLIANEHTADNVRKHEDELIFVKRASSELKSMIDSVPDKNLQRLIEKAYDLIHGSPVKSSPEVRSIETDIFNTINALSKQIANKEIANVEGSVNNICMLTEERNRTLKLLN